MQHKPSTYYTIHEKTYGTTIYRNHNLNMEHNVSKFRMRKIGKTLQRENDKSSEHDVLNTLLESVGPVGLQAIMDFTYCKIPNISPP